MWDSLKVFPAAQLPGKTFHAAAELRRSSEQPTDFADYDSNSRAASTAIAEYWVTAGLLWLQCSNSLYQCLLSQRPLVHGNRTGTSEKTAIAAIAESIGPQPVCYGCLQSTHSSTSRQQSRLIETHLHSHSQSQNRGQRIGRRCYNIQGAPIGRP